LKNSLFEIAKFVSKNFLIKSGTNYIGSYNENSDACSINITFICEKQRIGNNNIISRGSKMMKINEMQKKRKKEKEEKKI
jgi:hypothetical protein